MQKANSLEKTLMLGKTEGERRMEWQRMRWLASISNSMGMNLNKLWEITEERGAWHTTVHGSQRVRHDLVTEQPQLLLISTVWKPPKPKISHSSHRMSSSIKSLQQTIPSGFLKHLDKSAVDENPIVSVQRCLVLSYTVFPPGVWKFKGTRHTHTLSHGRDYCIFLPVTTVSQRPQSKTFLGHWDKNVAIPHFVCLVFAFSPRMGILRRAIIVCYSNANR